MGLDIMSNPFNLKSVTANFKYYSDGYRKAIFTVLCIWHSRKGRPPNPIQLISRQVLYAIFNISPEYTQLGFTDPGVVIVLAGSMSGYYFLSHLEKHFISVQKFPRTYKCYIITQICECDEK